MMNTMLRSFVGVLITSVCLLNPAAAVVRQDLQGNAGINIQGQEYSLRVVELLHQSALRDQPGFTLQQTTNLLIENHLLASQAIRQFGENHLLETENRVGFPGEYLLAMQFTATAEYLYQDAIKAQLPKKGLRQFITREFNCDTQELAKSLPLGKHQEFQLPDPELAAADKFIALGFKFPQAAPKKITLGDIYRQQNVQGRIALHEGNCDYLQAASGQYLGRLYIDYWMSHHSGLKKNEIEQLRMALRSRYLKDRYLAVLGIAQDVHDDSDYLVAKAKTITQDDINRYYLAHREQFTRVTKARGRHILVNDEALADQVYKELASGLDFNQAIKRYSVAEDKKANNPGTVDWVYNNTSASWRDTLFLILPAQQLNRPIKAPGLDQWEIVIVDERVEDFQAADSEGVRYQVSQILARKAIADELHNTRKRLLADAQVHVNPLLLRTAKP